MRSKVDADNGASAVSGALAFMNTNGDAWMGWSPWDLPDYPVTVGHASDGTNTEIYWYTPYLTASFLH